LDHVFYRATDGKPRQLVPSEHLIFVVVVIVVLGFVVVDYRSDLARCVQCAKPIRLMICKKLNMRTYHLVGKVSRPGPSTAAR
jgi:hypothetical protein